MTNARTQNKSYATEFTAAVATFARAGGDVPARIPEMLVNDFDAARAELWLWDQQSDCFYLTHTAGQEARHHLDYASAGTGAIGKFASSKSAAENVPLSSFGDDSPQFADAGGLGFVCAYPLVAAEQLSGVLVAYSAAEVPQDLLVIWRLYAGLSAVKLNDVLAAKEKDRRINQLSLMFEATRMLNSTLDLAELLELILKIASTELKADRGSVFLVDQKRNELWSIVASGLDRQEIRVPIGGGVAGRVASTGEVVNVNDAYTLSYFDPSFDLRFNYKTKSLLCVPIRHQVGGIVGVIQLLNAESGSFSAEDVAFLIELSGHIAMALENVRLHRDSIDKHLLERELSLARGIQRKLLPNAPPIVPGYEIAALRDFCYDVAGDYYDFLNLGPQSLLIVCAEVEGRGIASALLMAKLQATLQALVINLHSLEVLALSLNELLYQDTHAGKQLSLFMGLVDTRRNVLHYINAG
ncbi:MAG TPA: GAF domain-containing protein, partial [Alphaproteobacteria bacterium]|nr:GAF domain-containing protein [Alphaproteobacteria bacterium]